MKHTGWCGVDQGGVCSCGVYARDAALRTAARAGEEAHDAVKEFARAVETGDPVHSPSHYTQGGVECIDAIEAALGRDGFIAFLRGQVIKYQWRMMQKHNPVQDAAKAHWYSDRLQKVLAQ